MTNPIYSASPQDRLHDVIRCCESAKNMIDIHMIDKPSDWNNLQPGEFAVGNWLIRPRFPESPPSPWISVNDRLPEPSNREFLLVASALLPFIGRRSVGRWCYRGTENDIEGVTHWMPLPDPPPKPADPFEEWWKSLGDAAWASSEDLAREVWKVALKHATTKP